MQDSIQSLQNLLTRELKTMIALSTATYLNRGQAIRKVNLGEKMFDALEERGVIKAEEFKESFIDGQWSKGPHRVYNRKKLEELEPLILAEIQKMALQHQ